MKSCIELFKFLEFYFYVKKYLYNLQMNKKGKKWTKNVTSKVTITKKVMMTYLAIMKMIW